MARSPGRVGADATLLFEFFVPKQDASSAEVLPTDTGDDKFSPNQAYAEGAWDPLDPDDDVVDPVLVQIDAGDDVGGPEHVLEDQSIAIQKSVEVLGDGEVRPGALLKYTLNFQVSDYFAFDDVRITDVVSDGQRYCENTGDANSVTCSCPDGECTPTLSYAEDTVSLPAAIIDRRI